MGRIKTMLIKRTANKLFSQHRDSFKRDFKHNKGEVSKFADIPSKKLKNAVSGYITKMLRRK